MKEGKPMKLRYLEASDDLFKDTLVHQALEKDSIRDKILERLGIVRRPDESYLGAWIRAMAEENKVDVEEARAVIREEYYFNPEIGRFIFILA